MSLETMHDLLIDELKNLYSAEKQIIQALPKMIEGVRTKSLQKALADHLRQTEGQVRRLDYAFAILDRSARGKKCQGVESLLKEGIELLQEEGDRLVIDAGLIAAAQRVEHYQIAAYGAAATFAKLLGHHDIAELLSESLDEEVKADDLLSAIADAEVNLRAMETAFAEPTA